MATTADEVWQLLGELIEAQKESDRTLSLTRRVRLQCIQIRFCLDID